MRRGEKCYDGDEKWRGFQICFAILAGASQAVRHSFLPSGGRHHHPSRDHSRIDEEYREQEVVKGVRSSIFRHHRPHAWRSQRR